MRHLLRLATALTTTIAFLVPGAVLAQSTADWSGPYVGIGVTGLGSMSTLDTSTSVDLPESYDLSGSAFGGTLTAGFNLQYDQFVVGIEADGTLLSLSETLTGGSGTDTFDIDARLESLLTLRARLGFATGPFLIYGTTGLAAGKASFTATLQDYTGGTVVPATGSGVVIGPTVGAGVEYALNDNLSLKAEGLVYSLGAVHGSGDYGKSFSSPYDATYKSSGYVLKGGLNYRF